MEIGNLGRSRREALNALKDLEITDRFVDGKCSSCGECCSNLLPLTIQEIIKIQKYIEWKKIKPVHHRPAILVGEYIDMVCPFCDLSKKKKCLIYNARPEICRSFNCHEAAKRDGQCDIPVERLKKMLPVDMWGTFFPDDE